VAHVIYRLGTGGMENGLVNLINRTPAGRYRHAVICLTDADRFADRIVLSDVPVIALGHAGGHSFLLYWHLWRALRRLRPSIVHTRNLAALEAQVPARLIPGVHCVHGEHGRDVFDLKGTNRKYNLLRRAIRPLVHRYIAVSRDLAQWLTDTVRVAPQRVRQIYNGVDPERFRPRQGARPALAPAGFLPRDALVVGTIGRLAEVKDQLGLVRAFARLLRERPEWRDRMRLVLVGDGPQRDSIESAIAEEGIASLVWLAGDREDVPELLRMLDLFVLPSLGEGISNTVLEAMASGLPVIATRVGGNPELVEEGVTGTLVDEGDPLALAQAIAAYLADQRLLALHGAAGRARVAKCFQWDRCVETYLGVYDELLGRTADCGLRIADCGISESLRDDPFK
jgi:sugar transferase (PEP-CTERM/EpsH1 system associated)